MVDRTPSSLSGANKGATYTTTHGRIVSGATHALVVSGGIYLPLGLPAPKAKSKLVSRQPESDSLTTQVRFGGGGGGPEKLLRHALGLSQVPFGPPRPVLQLGGHHHMPNQLASDVAIVGKFNVSRVAWPTRPIFFWFGRTGLRDRRQP